MKEKNRDILEKAIGQLPDFKAGKRVQWGCIEAELERQQTMENKIKSSLPEFRAPETLWAKIDARMKAQHPVLSQAIEELPYYKAPADSWRRVQNELETSVKKVRSINIRIVTRVAAAVLLIVTIGLGIVEWKSRESDEKMILEFMSTKDSEFNSDMNLGINSIYNPALCKSNPQICETELFKSLEKQRTEIESEIKKMEPMIKDGDPQLMKYYHRLVNEQVEIEKRMVKLIIES